MIALAALTCDPNGHLIVPTRIINPYSAQRRGSIVATLDGKASHYDGGYSVSDLTLRAELTRPSKALLLRLHYLVTHYSQLQVACEAGVFIAVISFSLNHEKLDLQIRPLRRLDA